LAFTEASDIGQRRLPSHDQCGRGPTRVWWP